MTKVAVLDDWQGVARSSADWSPLLARADLTFFAQAFDDEDDAAAKLADFEIVLSMRERAPLPGSLINRLPKLRMLGITGARNASLDTQACTARGILVCNTGGGFHGGPSIIDHRTILKSGRLPLSFLRGCGVPDTLIDYLPSRLNEPIRFYSCFISYSHEDKAFARTFYAHRIR
jgi:hypothetical protein